MSEREVLVQAVATKEGVSQQSGKPWTRWTLRAADGEFYSTFNRALGEILSSYEGKRALVSFKEDGQFKNLETIRPADGQEIRAEGTKLSDQTVTPVPIPGDGSYIKGRENPDTQRAIAASVALKEAVATVAHTVPQGVSTEEIAAKVLPLAAKYLVFLLTNAGLDPDDGIPFS